MSKLKNTANPTAINPGMNLKPRNKSIADCNATPAKMKQKGATM